MGQTIEILRAVAYLTMIVYHTIKIVKEVRTKDR